jgi:mannonate dehydratase
VIVLAEVLLESNPHPFWRVLKQIGVDAVVGRLPRHLVAFSGDAEFAWDYAPLALYKEHLAEVGFELAAIEDGPPMDALRLGGEEREEQLEHFCTLVRNMGALDIPVLCYNWMPVLGPLRTSVAGRGRGGALVTGYDHALLAEAPLTRIGEVDAEQLWESLEWFLERAVPVAEAAGVRLAMHPDDPPLSPIRGIARIMSSVDSFQRLIDTVPSRANAITFCQGNFTLVTDDVPAAIRRFGEQDRIAFIHFRDVRGTPDSFIETFHEEGQTDMLECVRAYLDIEFDGPLRCDHTPTLEGDQAEYPGYSHNARLFAIGYIKGLIEAVKRDGALGATPSA